MKTRILSLAIVLAIFAQSNFAQDKKFNFGFKVAPAISWLSIDNPTVSSNGSVPKFNWGFVGAYNMSENFSFVTGFNVNSLGGKAKILTLNSTSKFSEFQLPAIFQMKTNEIGNLKYYAQIGLAAGYVFKAKDGDNNDISDATNFATTSYILAAGVEYPVSGGVAILGQLKYNGGLTSIAKSSETNYKADANFIELGLGILF